MSRDAAERAALRLVLHRALADAEEIRSGIPKAVGDQLEAVIQRAIGRAFKSK